MSFVIAPVFLRERRAHTEHENQCVKVRCKKQLSQAVDACSYATTQDEA